MTKEELNQKQTEEVQGGYYVPIDCDKEYKKKSNNQYKCIKCGRSSDAEYRCPFCGSYMVV